MSIGTITAGSVAWKIAYKVKGKEYTSTNEAGAGNPFEDVTLEPGHSLELGEEVDVISIKPITATGESRLAEGSPTGGDGGSAE